MATGIDQHVARWLERPEISARSVLVTILGDVIRPVGSSLWLTQMFELCEPFGFTQRLIRTSLFRLAADGWVESERVGRQSRYALTALALEESAAADQRIYTNRDPLWDGSWTILVVDRDHHDTKRLDRLVQHLRWRGFTPIERSILVAPNVSGVETRELLDLIDPATPVAVGEARFDDINQLITQGPFVDPFNRQDLEDAYRDFVATYEPITEVDLGALTPDLAYALRVALVHDRRRIVLRSPPPPRQLLPTPWIGDEAFATAASLYRPLCQRSADWLSQVLDLRYPAALPNRFT